MTGSENKKYLKILTILSFFFGAIFLTIFLVIFLGTSSSTSKEGQFKNRLFIEYDLVGFWCGDCTDIAIMRDGRWTATKGVGYGSYEVNESSGSVDQEWVSKIEETIEENIDDFKNTDRLTCDSAMDGLDHVYYFYYENEKYVISDCDSNYNENDPITRAIVELVSIIEADL